jgi:Flp pilus assembly protein TadD
MQVSLPPLISVLFRNVEAIPKGREAGALIADASEALRAYNSLPSTVKASYIQRLRKEMLEFQNSLTNAMEAQIANHEEHPTAESANLTGQLCAQAGRQDLAEKFFNQASDLDPTAVHTYIQHGHAQLQAESDAAAPTPVRLGRAWGLLRRARQVDPDLKAENLESTVGLLTDKTVGQEGQASRFQLDGMRALLAGNFDAAEDAFELAVDCEPDNPEYLNSLSLACSYTGQFARAAELAIKGLTLNPGGMTANLALATAGLNTALDAASLP